MATMKGLINLLLAPLLAWGWYENMPDLKAWALFIAGLIWAAVQIGEKYWSMRKIRAEAKMSESKREEKERKEQTDG